MKKHFLFFSLFVFFIIPFSWAQQKTITGIVNDKNGLPLPGASIVIENASRGVSSDFNGNYSIEAEENDVLIFREAKKARTSMERSFAARFIDEFKLYFQKNEGPLEFIKPKKKSLKQFFKSDLNHFETYLKNNQGDLNEVDYLRGLVEYMDELN